MQTATDNSTRPRLGSHETLFSGQWPPLKNGHHSVADTDEVSVIMDLMKVTAVYALLVKMEMKKCVCSILTAATFMKSMMTLNSSVAATEW